MSAVVFLGVTVGSALALECHGRLVVIGASPWEVKELCGELATVAEMTKYRPQRAYDSTSQTPVPIFVPVQQSIWTDNVGPTHCIYDLTFQAGKLIDIKTGDYGRSTIQRILDLALIGPRGILGSDHMPCSPWPA
jgi:hypothetical protein